MRADQRLSMNAKQYFRPSLFAFLRDLQVNNNRQWFLENKERYQSAVRDPMLEFIADFGPRLRTLSLVDRLNNPYGTIAYLSSRACRFSKLLRAYHAYIRAPLLSGPRSDGKGGSG